MKLIDFAFYKNLFLFPSRPSAIGSELTEDDLATLLNEIQEARSRAYYVGLNLKLPTDLLDSIMSQYSDHLDRLLHVLKGFLRHGRPLSMHSRVLQLACSNWRRKSRRNIAPLPSQSSVKVCMYIRVALAGFHLGGGRSAPPRILKS